MSEIRGEIADDFERIYRKAVARLEEAADSTTEYAETCPNPKCGRQVKVKGFPDVRALTAALQFLADQGIGKPSTAQAEAPKLDVKKPIQNMSTQERLELQALGELVLARLSKAKPRARAQASTSKSELPPAA